MANKRVQPAADELPTIYQRLRDMQLEVDDVTGAVQDSAGTDRLNVAEVICVDEIYQGLSLILYLQHVRLHVIVLNVVI